MLFSEFQELVSALPFPVVLYRAEKTARLAFRNRETGEEYSGRRYCFLLREGSPWEVRNSLADHLSAIKKDYSDFLRLVVITKGDSLVLNSEDPPYVYCSCPPLHNSLATLEPYVDGRPLYSVNTLTTIGSYGTGLTASTVACDTLHYATICLPANNPVLRITSDGKLLWKEREIETDDELRSAILDVRDALLSLNSRR